MTLGRLLLAWLPVAAWFCGVTLLRWSVARSRMPGDAPPLPLPFTRWSTGWLLVEAGVLTLFASLWFDSLGSGGWWLLFALVGFLVAFPSRMRQTPWVAGPLRRVLLIDGTIDVARYVAAGAMLCWRLA